MKLTFAVLACLLVFSTACSQSQSQSPAVSAQVSDSGISVQGDGLDIRVDDNGIKVGDLAHISDSGISVQAEGLDIRIGDDGIKVGSAAPAPVTTARAAQAGQVKTVPLSVQAAAPAGVTVRVKGAEIGGDVTVLDVSMSYSGFHSSLQLARSDTFIEDENGLRLPLRRLSDNRELRIDKDDMLQGQLVFLGHVPTNAQTLRLVFNEGEAADDDLWPKLELTLPLHAAAQ